MEFKDRLTELRKSKGLSQEELGNQMAFPVKLSLNGNPDRAILIFNDWFCSVSILIFLWMF